MSPMTFVQAAQQLARLPSSGGVGDSPSSIAVAQAQLQAAQERETWMPPIFGAVGVIAGVAAAVALRRT
jgi:hypothetical protein